MFCLKNQQQALFDRLSKTIIIIIIVNQSSLWWKPNSFYFPVSDINSPKSGRTIQNLMELSKVGQKGL